MLFLKVGNYSIDFRKVHTKIGRVDLMPNDAGSRARMACGADCSQRP
jgi:hypothetical protein